MPLYDLVLMLKKGVEKRSVVELLTNLGQRVYATRGVVTDVKSFGRVNLAYAIKKRDGRHNEQFLLFPTETKVLIPDRLKSSNSIIGRITLKTVHATFVDYAVVKFLTFLAIAGADVANDDDGAN